MILCMHGVPTVRSCKWMGGNGGEVSKNGVGAVDGVGNRWQGVNRWH